MANLPTYRRALLLTVLTLACVGGFAASAYGSYGDLGKPFGGKGKKSGQFTVTRGTHALGVDPTDNSVYVGDEPVEGAESGAEYRIQKFDSTGKFLASVSFKVKPEGPEGGYPIGLEGVAVDPTAPGGGRVYALVVYEREEEAGPKREKEIENGEAAPRIDAEEPAAGILYAFSTTPSGETLVPAKNSKGEAFPEGVLAGKVTLDAQSEAVHDPAHAALLDPAGIAVDPSTHDVILLGQEDQGEETLLTAAERITPEGALGARWVDVHGCFEGEELSSLCFSEGEEEEVQPGEPISPVVTPTGHVLVDVLGDEVWEVPSNFSAGGVPKPVLRYYSNLQTLLSFPGGLEPSQGGSLAFVHEPSEASGEGRLYQMGEVEPGTILEPRFPAVLAFKVSESGGALSISELGYTGGQNKKQHSSCAISAFSQPYLAGGTGQLIYVFDPDVPPGNSQETPDPHVSVFGPGGSGCLEASAEAPIATAKGTVVGTSGNPATVAETVTLTSKLALGNALSTSWNFGDGTTAEVATYQFQSPSVNHAFTAPGTYTVTETVHTDNLATPTLTAKTTVTVAAAAPTAQFAISASPTAGVPVKFTSTSTDPNKSALVKYVWKFGDGQETTTEAGTVEHTYTAAGQYDVSLQVTDALGLVGSTTREVSVAAPGAAEGPAGEPGKTTTGTGSTPGGATGVEPFTEHNARASLASKSLMVTASGAVSVKVSCAAGPKTCSGTITIKTLGPVAASAKKSLLTLASGSFTIAGGTSKTITLHLSAKARALLKRSHTLRARSTIVARSTSTGASTTTVAVVTLKAVKKMARA